MSATLRQRGRNDICRGRPGGHGIKGEFGDTLQLVPRGTVEGASVRIFGYRTIKTDDDTNPSNDRPRRDAERRPRIMEVPTGYTVFPADIEPSDPDAWLARTTTDLAHVSRPDHGGHFAPIEELELYASELRDFFRAYRTT